MSDKEPAPMAPAMTEDHGPDPDPTSPIDDASDQAYPPIEGGAPTAYGLSATAKLASWRKWIGLSMLAAGVVGAIAIFYWAAASLQLYDMASIIAVESDYAFWLVLAHSLTHGLVSVASLVFCYQLLKIGERLLLPLHMAEQWRDLLGVKMPNEMLGSSIQSTMRAVEKNWPIMEKIIDKFKSGPAS